MNRRHAVALGGPTLGLALGFVAFAVIVLVRPGPDLSAARMAVACAVLLLGPVVIGVPVSLFALRRDSQFRR